MCGLAGLCALAGLLLHFVEPHGDQHWLAWKLLTPTFFYGLALLLIVAALLWGNIGVIYSHAGLTG